MYQTTEESKDRIGGIDYRACLYLHYIRGLCKTLRNEGIKGQMKQLVYLVYYSAYLYLHYIRGLCKILRNEGIKGQIKQLVYLVVPTFICIASQASVK